MFSSIKLGKPFGIDLYVHGTFWLLPLFVFLSGVVSGDVAGAAFDVAVLLAVFGCVALHEVGHALAAKWYGIETRDITLYPLGGMARLERMPRRPLHEIVVALAGPAVNVMIVIGLLAGIVLGNITFTQGWASAGLAPEEMFISRLFWANVLLAAFNLIPAFPMDGGRVLRALLSIGMPRLEATQAAVTVGSVLAIGGFLFGFHEKQIMLMLVAGVVFMLGRAELAAVRAEEVRKRWHERTADFFDGPADPDDSHPTAPFTGWRWDPVRRVWSEWRAGALVREIPDA
ncbi:MAG: hypothetical protein JWO38_4179 [Gemmataceae bacterium]|nr:hypothetical protein [Gemmataceae bacterium]